MNNVDWVDDLYKRNLYQHHEVNEDTVTVKPPEVVSLSLRNLYQFWKLKFPEKIHIKMPQVLSLDIKNLFNRYVSTPVKLHVKVPEVFDIYLRSYLQKLFSYPLDDIITVELPEILDLHKKNIVDKYHEQEIGKMNIQLPEVEEMYLRNVLQTHTQVSEVLFLTIPEGIEISGTIKPYIRPPVLTGSVQLGEVFNIDLEWEDDSVTHTGYLLFRDTSPIPVDTTLEPIQEFDRETFTYEDWDLEEDTTYYYRVTPKSLYGRFFSNLLALDVPLYLRAPHSFTASFQSLSLPLDAVGYVNTLTKILNVSTGYLSTEKISSITGEYAYQIFMKDPVFSLSKLESPFEVIGTSEAEFEVWNAHADFASLEQATDHNASYMDEIYLDDVSSVYTTVEKPEGVDTSYGSLTKSFMENVSVILGSDIEDVFHAFTSMAPALSIEGTTSLEPVITSIEATPMDVAEVTEITGQYEDVINIETLRQVYASLGGPDGISITEIDTSVEIFNANYSYESNSRPAPDLVLYEAETSIRDVYYKFIDTTVTPVLSLYVDGGYISDTKVYCILGSDTNGIECRFILGAVPTDIENQWSSLTEPRRITYTSEEDQEFTLFSGYLPPVGYPLGYDTYVVGDSVIPVFHKQVIPGDMTRFTVYERMFKSKEVTSGYTPPNGVGIRFSLFVDED